MLISGCVPPKDKPPGKPVFDLSQPMAQKIFKFKDQQNVDSLLYFINHPDPMLRYNATRAFASFQTKEAVPYIIERLQDSIPEIQSIAAYAAGQLGDASLSSNLLNALDNENINSTKNKHILEAIGKIGTEKELELLVTADPYRKAHDTLNLGKALAIFEFGNRGIFHPKGTETMVKMTTEQYPLFASVVASEYLRKFSTIDLNPYKFQLLQALKKETNVHRKINLISVLSRLGSDELLDPIFEQILEADDSRVAYAGLQNLGKFNYIKTIERILDLLKDDDILIALGATYYIQNHGNAGDAFFYVNEIDKIQFDEVKVKLYSNVLRLIEFRYPLTRQKVQKQLLELFDKSDDLYVKRNIIKALANNPIVVEKSWELAMNQENILLQTAVVEGIGELLNDYIANSNRYIQNLYGPKLNEYLYQAVKTNDAGMISAALWSLNSTPKELIFDKWNRDSLLSVRQKLQFPRDLEPIYLMEQFADKLNLGSGFEIPDNPKAHVFDSTQFNSLGDSLIVNIKTTKGVIMIEMLSNHAPTTVINFMELVHNQYYNDKYFHRVVPNFVVQAGCPRGDGYGSLDYTVPSEVGPLRYLDEGMVGMASMGLHTEGSQFFITHVPTPHLSGRYTIFGKVKKGMDVVNNLIQGDQILSITY